MPKSHLFDLGNYPFDQVAHYRVEIWHGQFNLTWFRQQSKFGKKMTSAIILSRWRFYNIRDNGLQKARCSNQAKWIWTRWKKHKTTRRFPFHWKASILELHLAENPIKMGFSRYCHFGDTQWIITNKVNEILLLATSINYHLYLIVCCGFKKLLSKNCPHSMMSKNIGCLSDISVCTISCIFMEKA